MAIRANKLLGGIIGLGLAEEIYISEEPYYISVQEAPVGELIEKAGKFGFVSHNMGLYDYFEFGTPRIAALRTIGFYRPATCQDALVIARILNKRLDGTKLERPLEAMPLIFMATHPGVQDNDKIVFPHEPLVYVHHRFDGKPSYKSDLVSLLTRVCGERLFYTRSTDFIYPAGTQFAFEEVAVS